MSNGDIIMGFDYGTRKIGVATGQLITRTANPIAIVPAKDGIPNWADIEKLIKEWKPSQLVVGLPLNMDGSESEMSIRALKFARRLTGRFNLPHHTIDERLSTREAREQSTTSGQIDDIAAKIILESWLSIQP
ncbi:MAG: putative Holliday junction resolvase [Candidatus Azotimanducaceae bacterium]|jgi:putative Holliday junction resolvase